MGAMKKKEIKPALDALKTIKIHKFEDKELRNQIIQIHIRLLAEQKKYDADFGDMRTAFLAAYEDEQNTVTKLQADAQAETDRFARAAIFRQIEADHKDYLDAVREFNRNAERLGDEDIKIDSIETDRFVGEYQKQDYNLGVVEALYPLFIKTN